MGVYKSSAPSSQMRLKRIVKYSIRVLRAILFHIDLDTLSSESVAALNNTVEA